MGDEEDGRGAVTSKAENALQFAIAAVIVMGIMVFWLAYPRRQPDVEWLATRQKRGAEADALDMILRERQEPQGGITCYRRAGRYECPLHLAGQPTRWAACRLRREDEWNDDGGRCAWIVDSGR